MADNEQPSSTLGVASTNNPGGIPPAAPAPAPAAEPAPAPAPEPAPAPVPPAPAPVDTSKPLSVDAPEIVPVKFEPSGNPTIDIINDFVGSKGIGPDSEEYQAALKGDFEPLEAKFKALGEQGKGYERYLSAAKQEFQNAKAAHEAKHGATITACHEMAKEVGGWDSLSAWVRENADPSELAEINEALAAGGMAAKQTVRYLVDLRKQNPDKPQPGNGTKSPVKENASTVRDATGGALSPVQYQKEIQALVAKHGHNYVHTDEYKDVQRRRAAFRG